MDSWVVVLRAAGGLDAGSGAGTGGGAGALCAFGADEAGGCSV